MIFIRISHSRFGSITDFLAAGLRFMLSKKRKKKRK